MNKLVVILGPTASGKTALAHELAGVFAGEIINADSRQMYKGLTIGTAKPDYAQSPIPYHLFDILEPDEEFSIAQFKTLAVKTIQGIQKKGKLPFLVGGSGLYIQAIVDNLKFPEVPAQKELRAMLEKKTEEELLAMLKERDLAGVQMIDSANKRRIIRALEVTMVSGQPFSKQLRKGPDLFQTLQLGIDIPRDQLLANIELRTHQMIDQGLEEEVVHLVEHYGWNALLRSTIGYKEWESHGDQQKTLEQVKDEIVKNTKTLVKKQYTWFGKQKAIQWVENKEEAQQTIEEFLKRRREYKRALV